MEERKEIAMLVYENFEKLKELAKTNPELKAQLLATRGQTNALTNFCKIATQNGCDMNPMDVVEAGEASYAAMRRSTNGGGENSPMLGTWNNFFEMFLSELESTAAQEEE